MDLFNSLVDANPSRASHTSCANAILWTGCAPPSCRPSSALASRRPAPSQKPGRSQQPRVHLHPHGDLLGIPRSSDRSTSSCHKTVARVQALLARGHTGCYCTARRRLNLRWLVRLLERVTTCLCLAPPPGQGRLLVVDGTFDSHCIIVDLSICCHTFQNFLSKLFVCPLETIHGWGPRMALFPHSRHHAHCQGEQTSLPPAPAIQFEPMHHSACCVRINNRLPLTAGLASDLSSRSFFASSCSILPGFKT